MLVRAEAPPPAPEPSSRRLPRIDELVPHDPWFRPRVVLMGGFALTYLWWCRTQGLVSDRISVTVALMLFLVCAFVGKPWQRWRVLVGDAALYAGMWFCYEMTRGAADRLGFPYQAEALRNLDRWLFLGTDPTLWMYERFFRTDVQWYDKVASTVYYTHFVLPVIAVAVLWATSRVQWVRFMKRFATVLAIACATFVVLPSVPPWMATSPRYEYRLLRPLPRHTWRGFQELGFHGFVFDWQRTLDWSNAVAAMPSLHTAFALFVPAFFLPMIRRRWLKALVLVHPVAMLASLVYFGEHWVVDGLAGALLVGASFLLWHRLERRAREHRAASAERALDDLACPSPA